MTMAYLTLLHNYSINVNENPLYSLRACVAITVLLVSVIYVCLRSMRFRWMNAAAKVIGCVLFLQGGNISTRLKNDVIRAF